QRLRTDDKVRRKAIAPRIAKGCRSRGKRRSSFALAARQDGECGSAWRTPVPEQRFAIHIIPHSRSGSRGEELEKTGIRACGTCGRERNLPGTRHLVRGEKGRKYYGANVFCPIE